MLGRQYPRTTSLWYNLDTELDPRIKSEGDSGASAKRFHTSRIHPALDTGSKTFVHFTFPPSAFQAYPGTHKFFNTAVGPLGLPRNPRRLVPSTKSVRVVATHSVVIPDLVWDPGRTFQEPRRRGPYDIHAWIPACAGMTVVVRSNCSSQYRNPQAFYVSAVGLSGLPRNPRQLVPNTNTSTDVSSWSYWRGAGVTTEGCDGGA